MLNAAQKSRCRELAQALDRGDMATYRRAEPALTPEMRGEVWDQRQRQAQGGRGRLKPLTEKVQYEGAAMRDLDYWADTDDPPDDDPDDELTLKTKVCDNCRGLGTTSDGTRCTRCNGTGRVDRDDVDDGDGEDDDHDEDDES